MRRINLYGDNLLVKPISPEAGDSPFNGENLVTGEIVAAGEGRWLQDGTRASMPKEGDKAVFDTTLGRTLTIEGEPHYIIDVDDLFFSVPVEEAAVASA